ARSDKIHAEPLQTTRVRFPLVLLPFQHILEFSSRPVSRALPAAYSPHLSSRQQTSSSPEALVLLSYSLQSSTATPSVDRTYPCIAQSAEALVSAPVIVSPSLVSPPNGSSRSIGSTEPRLYQFFSA